MGCLLGGWIDQCLGMQGRIALIPAECDVDGSADSKLMAGLDLFTEQVKFEIRVPFPNFGWIVAPAVMAHAEQGDGIDMPLLQGLLP